MRRIAFVLYLLLFSATGFSQKLIVRDASTLRGIANVLVFSQQQSEISNQKGEVNLTKFTVGDSLYLQHSSYNATSISLTTKEVPLEIALIEKSIKLDAIVVSVNRWEEPSSEFPNKVVGFTAQDIEFSNPQTTADALTQTGEIYVQKSQLGGGSPMIRGFAANRILLTVDGIRLNNAIYRSGNLQNIISIDAHSLERTEVIFGPGSVQYGSDALGGVVNMMMLSAQLSNDKPIVNGSSLLRYTSANNERTAHIDLAYASKQLASVTSISYSKYGDLMMGTHGPEEYLRPQYVTTVNGTDNITKSNAPQKQISTGFSQYSFIQKLKFKLSDYLTSEAGFYASKTSNIPRYDRLIQNKNGTLRYADWHYGPQEWLMAKVEFNYANKNSLMDIGKIQMAYQQVKESRHDRDFGALSIRNRYEIVDIFSINADFAKPISEHHHLYYGLNAGFNVVTSLADETVLLTGNKVAGATRYPDGSHYNNYAVYFNYEYKLQEHLNFMAGVRYSQFVSRSTFETSFYPFPFASAKLSPGAPSGSIGVVITPNKKTTFQVNISSAFRAPNIDDIGKVFDSEPGNVVVPNIELGPEYAYNLDFGISRNIGELVKIEVTGFYTFLDKAMVRRNATFNGQDSIMYDGELSKVQTLANAASAHLYGFNAKLFIDFSKNWSFTSAFNLVKGEDDQHLPLRHVTPAFGSSHLLFKHNRLKLDLYADYSGGFSNRELTPEERNKAHLYALDQNGQPYSPSWFTLNIKTTVQLLKVIRLNFGIENILDKRYKTYSSGLVAPGRNLMVGIRAFF